MRADGLQVAGRPDIPDGTSPASHNEDHRKAVRDTLSSGVALGLAARAGYLLTRFLIPPFVLAHIGLEAYGLWATTFILVSYVGISTLGMSNVYIKYIAEYAARREFKRANQLLSTGLTITIPLCAAIYIALHLSWSHVASSLHIAPALQRDAHEVVLTVVGIFLASISLSAFRDALTGMQCMATVQGTWVVAYLLETAVIVVLVAAGRGIRGLSEAFLVRTVFEIATAMYFAFRRMPWLRLSPRLSSREALRTIWSFGGISQVSSLVAIALSSIERALAVPLIGLQAAGLLDIAKKLPGMAAAIPGAFSSSLLPAASFLHSGLKGEAQGAAVKKLYLKGARYMNLAAGFICGPLATLPGPMLAVWLGRAYPGATLLMVVFAISMQTHMMTGPGTSLLKGLGRPKEEFRYCLPNILALLIALPLARLITGAWTSVGIGVAVAASTLIAAVWFIRHANREFGIPAGQYARYVLWPGALPYLAGLLFLWPATVLTAGVSRWRGAVALAFIGFAYSSLLALVIDRFVLDKGERLWFRAIAASKFEQIKGRMAGLRDRATKPLAAEEPAACSVSRHREFNDDEGKVYESS
jgi:O-antigen/teichoic acid export membrane protein